MIAVVAILIVSGTIVYSKYLARKISTEERQKVGEWVEAGKFLINSPADADTRLPYRIIENNKDDVPIIETNEKDSIIQFINLDTIKVVNDKSYLRKTLQEFKDENQPVIWINPLDSTQRNLYYYGDRKSTRLNSSHIQKSRMPSSA